MGASVPPMKRMDESDEEYLVRVRAWADMRNSVMIALIGVMGATSIALLIVLIVAHAVRHA